MALLSIYKQMIRSSTEYASVVYHSLIPRYLSDKLESVQRQAMKIIFGRDVDYNSLVEDEIIEPLYKRREDSILKFAIKASNTTRFGTRWFTRVPNIPTELRPGIRKTFVEKHYWTERGRNNPLGYMTRKLNEHMSNEEQEAN